MSRILAVSSYVAAGHVGLAAIVPALQAMGHEVIAVPTVVLSCHYGHAHVGGIRLEPEQVGSLINGLAANGLLQSVDAVLTGYLSSVDIVDGVARVLERLGAEHPDVLYLCDPVLGDDPGGLYVGEEVATAIRELLVPLADIVTPNRFELAWLTGEAVGDAGAAKAAAKSFGADLVTVTSVPAGAHVANVMCDADGATQFVTRRLTGVPHGTGDLFAALVLGHRLCGRSNRESVARASAGVAHVIGASLGQAELSLVQTIGAAIHVPPADGDPIV